MESKQRRYAGEGLRRIGVRAKAKGTEAAAAWKLRAGLRKAVENGELLVHYQPKVDIRTGIVAGAEALVRWRHPDAPSLRCTN